MNIFEGPFSMAKVWPQSRSKDWIGRGLEQPGELGRHGARTQSIAMIRNVYYIIIIWARVKRWYEGAFM